MENLAEHICQQIQLYVSAECHDLKKLEPEQIEKIKNAFQLTDIYGDIFYTDYNLIFTNNEDYQNFEHLVGGSEVVFNLSIPEYGLQYIFLRYASDDIFDEILN